MGTRLSPTSVRMGRPESVTVAPDDHLADVKNTLELVSVVGINEDIKEVMRIARGLDLAAINAMLIAKKIGAASSGFSVVSAELRTFSSRLGVAMGELLEVVSVLVNEVAGMIRFERVIFLQQATHAASANYPHWACMWQRKTAELETRLASINNCCAQLANALAYADKLCVMGQSLSYSAKVEAVYGGEQANALKNVSERVENSVHDILVSLKRLGRQLEAMA